MKIRVNDIPKPWGAGALPFLHVLGEAAPRKILPGEIVELGEDSLGTRVVEQLLAAGVISALWTPTDDVATPVPPVPPAPPAVSVPKRRGRPPKVRPPVLEVVVPRGDDGPPFDDDSDFYDAT